MPKKLKRKMKRQGISLSLKDIQKLKIIIEDSLKEIEHLGASKKSKDIKVLLSIINRSDCSDTWEFEY